jgi:hypothetical protein
MLAWQRMSGLCAAAWHVRGSRCICISAVLVKTAIIRSIMRSTQQHVVSRVLVVCDLVTYTRLSNSCTTCVGTCQCTSKPCESAVRREPRHYAVAVYVRQ